MTSNKIVDWAPTMRIILSEDFDLSYAEMAGRMSS